MLVVPFSISYRFLNICIYECAVAKKGCNKEHFRKEFVLASMQSQSSSFPDCLSPWRLSCKSWREQMEIAFSQWQLSRVTWEMNFGTLNLVCWEKKKNTSSLPWWLWNFTLSRFKPLRTKKWKDRVRVL